MHFPPYSNLHLIATKEVRRLSLEFIRIEDGHAIATDGRALAITPVTMGPGDHYGTGLIPSEAVAAAAAATPESKPVTLRLETDKVTWQQSATEGGTILGIEDRGEGLNYPDWRKPIPAPSHGVRITLDARRLLTLAEALPGKTPMVHIHIDTDNPADPFVITKPHQEGLGLLMPATFLSDPASDLKTHLTSAFAFMDRRLAAARHACYEAREFWTTEKQEAALASA